VVISLGIWVFRRRIMGDKRLAYALIGDRYHNSDYIRTALKRTLGEGIGLTIDFTDDYEALGPEVLEGCKLLVVFRDGMIWPSGYGETEYRSRRGSVPITSEPPVPDEPHGSVPWMTENQGEAVKRFVLGGGAALLCHNVTYIATHNAAFRNTLGAATQGHPPVRPYRVEIVNRTHPITRDAVDFVVTDEQHYLTYDGDPDHVLMMSVNDDGLDYKGLGTTCEAGWAFEYGQGRVCYLAPGHTIPALWNPEFVKIQQNAVRWLLREI
jgi:hypothetical protein